MQKTEDHDRNWVVTLEEKKKVYPPKELALKLGPQQEADPATLIWGRTFQALRKECDYKTDRKKEQHSSENGVCDSVGEI